MAVTVTCTPGGASDNSYISKTDSDAYFNDTLRDKQWTTWRLTDDASRALIDATKRIEALGGRKVDTGYPTRQLFTGVALDVTTPQALHFPRSGDVDSEGDAYVPQEIADAVCEQAYWMLELREAGGPLVDRDALRDDGVTGWSADGMSESLGRRECPRGICPAAWDLVKPCIIGAGVGAVTRAG